jgi:hypothetical protein
MLYKGPFSTAFYRQLHRVLHKEFRRRKAWEQIKSWRMRSTRNPEPHSCQPWTRATLFSDPPLIHPAGRAIEATARAPTSPDIEPFAACPQRRRAFHATMKRSVDNAVSAFSGKPGL